LHVSGKAGCRYRKEEVMDVERELDLSDEAMIARAFERYQALADTSDEPAYSKVVEDYIGLLQWSDETGQEVRDYVAMNLRGFWGFVKPLVKKISGARDD
jgi:hypothetical protein